MFAHLSVCPSVWRRRRCQRRDEWWASYGVGRPGGAPWLIMTSTIDDDDHQQHQPTALWQQGAEHQGGSSSGLVPAGEWQRECHGSAPPPPQGPSSLAPAPPQQHATPPGPLTGRSSRSSLSSISSSVGTTSWKALRRQAAAAQQEGSGAKAALWRIFELANKADPLDEQDGEEGDDAKVQEGDQRNDNQSQQQQQQSSSAAPPGARGDGEQLHFMDDAEGAQSDNDDWLAFLDDLCDDDLMMPPPLDEATTAAGGGGQGQADSAVPLPLAF